MNGVIEGVYEPVQHHWFHCEQQVDCKDSWFPFSREDSPRLEEAHKHGMRQFIIHLQIIQIVLVLLPLCTIAPYYVGCVTLKQEYSYTEIKDYLGK